MGFAFPLALLLLPLPALVRLLPPVAARGGLLVPAHVLAGTSGRAARAGCFSMNPSPVWIWATSCKSCGWPGALLMRAVAWWR